MARSLFLVLCFLPGLAWTQSPGKRPLTHADYDIWNRITGMTLSPDGKFAAWTLAPTKGDSTFIVRNLESGTEWKFAKGGTTLPGEPAATPEKEEEFEESTEDQPRAPIGSGFGGGGGGPGGGPAFTPDSKYLYFTLTPTRAEIDKAAADKKETPKPVLAVLDLATGKIKEKIPGVRSFSITGTGAGILVMVKEARTETKPDGKTETAPMPKSEKSEKPDQEPQPPEPKTPEPQPEPKQPEPKKEEKKDEAAEMATRGRSGNDHVIRNLADGTEVTYPEVAEYSITRDFANIVCTRASKKSEANGVYYSDLFAPDKAQTLVKGPGRYYRLSWDEKQARLAFYYDDSPPPPAATPGANTPGTFPGRGGGGQGGRGQGGGRFGGGQPNTPNIPALPNSKPRVYVWNRPAKNETFHPAVLTIGQDTPGLKKGWQIVDRGQLSFSADGQKLNVSAAPIPEKPAETKRPTTGGFGAGSSNDRVELDLWHWKDEQIQPQQRLRGATARNRSFPAVYLFDSKKLVPMGDEDATVRVPDHGDWALGSTDKKYRAMTWESPTPSDYSLVNIRTGESKPLLTAARSGLTASPKGGYLAGFDGKHWFTVAVPDGKKTILTENLKTKFFNEDFDSPMVAPSYGLVGWCADDKHLVVSDKFDLWMLAADGSESVNMTGLGTASGIRFRLARVEKPEDDDPANPRERGLDTTVPWLLAAEHVASRESGFYRLEPGGRPKKLHMGPKSYSTPVKAKKADTMILTVSDFADFADYFTASGDFKTMTRITDANPHRKDFNWATTELINYTNTDGQKLGAILVKPENFDPTKKYPMIIYIYERLSNTLHNYHSPSVTRGQTINPIWYASNGYLVLMPDIAYKVGYPGQSALQCVLPAIQATVDRGWVDEKAIGINGQSWGGYQIAYMITQTNRFKAAVAGAAVTNMTSAYNGIRWGSGMPRQFQYERTQSRIGQTLWEAPMKFIENSPVFFADRVQTPLMMINNDQDDAVPWYQGIEFYLSLRRLGKECYMLNYNGEPHNLARQVNARDFALRMQQFFDHHLKGAPMPDWMAKGIPYADRDKEKEQWKKLFNPEKPATKEKEKETKSGN